MVCLHGAQSLVQGSRCPGELTSSYSSLDKEMSARHTVWAAASVVAGSGVCASVRYCLNPGNLQGWKIKQGLPKHSTFLAGCAMFFPACLTSLQPRHHLPCSQTSWKSDCLVSPVSFLDIEMRMEEFWQIRH